MRNFLAVRVNPGYPIRFASSNGKFADFFCRLAESRIVFLLMLLESVLRMRMCAGDNEVRDSDCGPEVVGTVVISPYDAVFEAEL
ncbi:MAG: hypothetical protein V8T87_16115 [Victivallales bacterium]